ncbi:MAG TPA: hypothetical protein VGM99_04145 [Candidatus Cybelea sp.]
MTASRILLGLAFTLAGGSIFWLVGHPPPMPPGLAGSFTSVFFASHWVVFVDLVELAAGLLLLFDRFGTLAIVLLGAIFANILVFHLTMQPQTIPIPLILIVLWAVVAYDRRTSLAVLFGK